MDKLTKALAKLSAAERRKIKAVLMQLKSNDLSGLDLKKLAGRDDIYRVRKGRIRIILRRQGDEIYILAVEHRSDRTYKNL